MKYRLHVGEEVVPVKLEVEPEGELRISFPDRELQVAYERISENRIHLRLKGQHRVKNMDVFVARGPQGKEIMINGRGYLVQDADLLEQKAVKKAGRKQVPQTVTPPMPSVVVKILVQEGERVEKGRGVVVVSAMKMETTLSAPYRGVIRKINVAVGDKASPGEILADIDPEPEQPFDPLGFLREHILEHPLVRAEIGRNVNGEIRGNHPVERIELDRLDPIKNSQLSKQLPV